MSLIQPLLERRSRTSTRSSSPTRRKRAALYCSTRQTVQTAFQDVADALVAYTKYGEQEREQARQVDALQRAREIALARYRIGYASYFDVIQADRDLFAAQLALAQAYADNLSALVQLYSALGGGWQERPAATAPAAGGAIKANHRS